jgi:hypothetical protein
MEGREREREKGGGRREEEMEEEVEEERIEAKVNMRECIFRRITCSFF